VGALSDRRILFEHAIGSLAREAVAVLPGPREPGLDDMDNVKCVHVQDGRGMVFVRWPDDEGGEIKRSKEGG
jgi:hypothetical protein